jgi:hypothetical protein
MQEKALRYDVIIAVSALLISAVTSTAVVYQTHVISQQFSATVWPYVSFDVTRQASSLNVAMRNDGVGPALIRSVAITVDGKRVPSLNAVVDPILSKARHRYASVSSIESGEVLPANQRVTLVQVNGADATRLLMAMAPHVNLSVCYCSLLGRCWITQFNDRSEEPRDVARCPV